MMNGQEILKNTSKQLLLMVLIYCLLPFLTMWISIKILKKMWNEGE